MNIHVFGSSHVSQFCGEDRIICDYGSFEAAPFNFFATRVGPSTCYNFFWRSDYYERVLNDIAHIDKGSSYVSLFIGEIDCRVHIGRRIESGTSLTDGVEEVVDRYFLNIIDLKQKGYKPLVFAIQPTSDHPSCPLTDCPATGSPEFRNKITREFNRFLERKCKIHAVPFISIFDKLMKSENEVDMTYFMDYVHLRGSLVRSMYVEEMIKTLGL
jgi:hypothetical protein